MIKLIDYIRQQNDIHGVACVVGKCVGINLFVDPRLPIQPCFLTQSEFATTPIHRPCQQAVGKYLKCSSVPS